MPDQAKPSEREKEEAYKAECDDILAGLPEEFRGAIEAYAYQQGHYAGYGEVLSYLRSMEECFRGPIEKYTKRVSPPTSRP